MTDHLTETAAEVAALIPQYSWEIMDEQQRDDLILRIVEPRYMQTTVDGVQLGPTFWADLVGASSEAIKKRVYRVSESETPDDGKGPRALSDSRVRHARSALQSADDEQLERIVESLPPERREALADAVERDGAQAAVDTSLDVQVARMFTQVAKVDVLLREGRTFNRLDHAKADRLDKDLDHLAGIVVLLREAIEANSTIRRVA